MADFCKKCSIEMFGSDTKDLEGLITKEQWDGGFAATVLCEGCCAGWVDHEGNRVKPSEDGESWVHY